MFLMTWSFPKGVYWLGGSCSIPVPFYPLQWDAFSMPELHNFLRILQREEEEHLRQILQKYSYCRQKIQEALHACPLG